MHIAQVPTEEGQNSSEQHKTFLKM